MTNDPLHRSAARPGFGPWSLIRHWSWVIGHLLFAVCCLAFTASAQPRPYIGYVYPAGGQQGTTFQIRLGGQYLDDANAVSVTGSGVGIRVVEYLRRIGPQEIQLLNEQVRELKKATSAVASVMAPMMKPEPAMMAAADQMMTSPGLEKSRPAAGKDEISQKLIARIERRMREYVQIPACDSIASLVIAEVTLATNAEPGVRELRLVTPRGVSNPLVFCVGQLPEFSRPPMITAIKQVLGKEAQALRKRATNEVEEHITIPCVVNGQIASGEVNRHLFTARRGQRLVVATQARQLIPYIADAVPGWFQPMLTLYDAQGKELAFADDYRFKPDPVLRFDVPRDGEYVFAITDAIYRGREDFIYRVSIGELPFVTGLFPLGASVGTATTPKLSGWNLEGAETVLTGPADAPGTQTVVARSKDLLANPMPFARDLLPDGFEAEPNDTPKSAQRVTLPIVVNGRIGRPDDSDVFRFTGKSNDWVTVEVQARRLESPLDSVIQLTDANGRVLAFNDDHEDLGAGVNTHQADSWFMTRLPADGAYFVRLGDTARHGGRDCGYRLRISAPQPDFDLRVVPSSVSLRTNSAAAVSVYAQRKDGFAGPIKLALKDPPAGFSAAPVTLASTQTVARLTIKGPRAPTDEPVKLTVTGSAKVGPREIAHDAVPAEDRMQAFLWRHLVPAADLQALVFDPGFQPPLKRAFPVPPPAVASTNVLAAVPAGTATNSVAGTNVTTAAKPKFSKSQVASRLRQLKLLFQEGLLTDDFYCDRVAECEAAQ